MNSLVTTNQIEPHSNTGPAPFQWNDTDVTGDHVTVKQHLHDRVAVEVGIEDTWEASFLVRVGFECVTILKTTI